MEIDYFRFAIAVLATFRIAHLLPDDDGPLYVFQRIRLFVDRQADKERAKGVPLGFWQNVYDGITCAYCQGLYAAVLCAILLIYPTVYGDVFLFALALAGAQTMLQKWEEKL
jgi:hypothetical protein